MTITETLDEYAENGIPNEALKFKPDDFKEYWKNLPNEDPVCICGIPNQAPEDINRLNKQLLKIGNLPLFLRYDITYAVCDIGSGYGATGTYLEELTKLGYNFRVLLTDIVSRDEKIVEIEDGKIPANNESCDIIICSNVWQHLNLEQRNLYLDEIDRILTVNGLFYLITPAANMFYIPTRLRHMETNTHYCYSGLYFTPIPTLNEILEIEQRKLYCRSLTQLSSGMAAFIFQKL